MLKVLGTWYFILGTFFCQSQNLPTRPNPPRLVNDFVNILSSSEKETLEKKLVAFNDSTSSQIAIVLVKTTDEYPVDDYAIALYRTWGIGAAWQAAETAFAQGPPMVESHR